MAHFAQLDTSNNVVNVITVNNNSIKDENGVEQESLGIDLCKSLYGANSIWKQTSYNNSIRGKYAKIGGYYNKELDIFMPEKKPYPSWKANAISCNWEAPVKKPENNDVYVWDETKQEWIFVRKALFS